MITDNYYFIDIEHPSGYSISLVIRKSKSEHFINIRMLSNFIQYLQELKVENIITYARKFARYPPRTFRYRMFEYEKRACSSIYLIKYKDSIVYHRSGFPTTTASQQLSYRIVPFLCKYVQFVIRKTPIMPFAYLYIFPLYLKEEIKESHGYKYNKDFAIRFPLEPNEKTIIKKHLCEMNYQNIASFLDSIIDYFDYEIPRNSLIQLLTQYIYDKIPLFMQLSLTENYIVRKNSYPLSRVTYIQCDTCEDYLRNKGSFTCEDMQKSPNVLHFKKTIWICKCSGGALDILIIRKKKKVNMNEYLTLLDDVRKFSEITNVPLSEIFSIIKQEFPNIYSKIEEEIPLFMM